MTRSADAVPPLLIVSCDRYQDVWKPFFAIFRRQWPDCPFPVYLGTNSLHCDEPGVETLNIGSDKSWSDDLAAMVRKLNAPHVLLFLDDFFILERVCTADVKNLVAMAVDNALPSVRLAPLPDPTPLPPHPLPGHPQFGAVPPGYPYRVSSQAAIWRSDVLLELLERFPGANIWQWEHYATQLYDTIPSEFWGPFQPYIKYLQVVEKGRWTPIGIELAMDAGVNVDLESRGSFTGEEIRQHYLNATEKPGSTARRRSVYEFLRGNRLGGLRNAVRAVEFRPSDLRLPLFTLFGLMGKGPLKWLLRKNVEHKWRALAISRNGK